MNKANSFHFSSPVWWQCLHYLSVLFIDEVINLAQSVLKYYFEDMGRKGSYLVPFFKDSLDNNKYINLKPSNAAKNAFSLNLPHKKRLKVEHQHIFEDWYRLKRREYRYFDDYSKAKGGMEAALGKSMFFEIVKKLGGSELIYRILDEEEVRDKKKGLKVKNTKDFESGYGRQSDSSNDFIEDGNLESESISGQDIVKEEMEFHYQQLSEFSEGSLMFDSKYANEVLDDISEIIQQDSDCFREENIPSNSVEDNWMEEFVDDLKELPDLNQDAEKVLNNGGDDVTKLITVYELKEKVNLSDGVVLIFEHKLKGVSSMEHPDPNKMSIIIDEETFRMMSRSNYIETNFLNKHLLVFLKPVGC